MKTGPLIRALVHILLIVALFIASGLSAAAAWQVLLDGVDISGAASPLERGGTILVNATALAPVLHFQLTVRGNLVTIRDTHGIAWQAQDGSITMLSDGRSLSLPYPLLFLEGNIYLPIDTVNILDDHHLVLDKTDDAKLTSEKIGDGWQAVDIPKPAALPGQQPATTTSSGVSGNAALINLPPATDHMLLDVGLGYVQGADMGIQLNAVGPCYGNELQMSGLLSCGKLGTQFNNGYLSLVNRAARQGIELGNLSSDLLGGMDGVRFSWRKGTNHLPALSLYWDQLSGDLHHPVVSFRDNITLSRVLSVGGEVDSRAEVELHSQYQPGRFGLYTDFRHTLDPAQSGASMFTTYALQNGMVVSGGMTHNGAGASQSDWSDMSVRIPWHHGFDLTLDHSKSQAGPITNTTINAAMLTVPVGKLRVLTRFAVGQTAYSTTSMPSISNFRDLMVSTGYNIRPNLRVDIQTMTHWLDDTTVNHSLQFVSAYGISHRSHLLLVSSQPYPGSPGQCNLRWDYAFSDFTAISLEYGQLTPFQSGSMTTGRGMMVMLHTRWEITTPTRGARVTGTVRDEDGRLLADCLVRLGDYRTLTNSLGQYHFEHVPAGQYDIAIDKSSLPANDRSTAGVYRLNVRNGDRVTHDFRVIPLYAITGKLLLVDSDGKSIEGSVSGVVLRLGEAATVTDAAGAFGFFNLAPGTYTVRLDIERLPSTLAPVGATEFPVTLQPSGEMKQLIFKVMPHDKDIMFQDIPERGK